MSDLMQVPETRITEDTGIWINDVFEVVLNESGAQAVNDYYAGTGLPSHHPEPFVSGETYRTTVWSAFSLFGPLFGIGKEMPFESSFVGRPGFE